MKKIIIVLIMVICLTLTSCRYTDEGNYDFIKKEDVESALTTYYAYVTLVNGEDSFETFTFVENENYFYYNYNKIHKERVMNGNYKLYVNVSDDIVPTNKNWINNYFNFEIVKGVATFKLVESVSDKKFGNESSLIFVDGKIIVKINFATKDVTYLDVDPIPTTAEAIYSSVYGSLKDAYYE